MKSGMLAADTIADALAAEDFSGSQLSMYDQLFENSWLPRRAAQDAQLPRQLLPGFLVGRRRQHPLDDARRPHLPQSRPLEPDHETMQKKAWSDAAMNYDGALTYDKVTGVYNAGAVHNEHQPSHLKIADTDICRTKCAEEYGNPCESFCPAAVYEMVDAVEGGKRMQINFSNCVHCKTCDVMDPYAIIDWTVPSDAGGPKYMGM